MNVEIPFKIELHTPDNVMRQNILKQHEIDSLFREIQTKAFQAVFDYFKEEEPELSDEEIMFFIAKFIDIVFDPHYNLKSRETTLRVTAKWKDISGMDHMANLPIGYSPKLKEVK